jgi:hypothetical protein
LKKFRGKASINNQKSTISNCSLLALRAVVAAAAGDYDAFDGSFADEAGFPFASVDAVLELEESFFAVGIDVVGDRRATEGNGFFQDFFHGGVKFGELVASYGGSAAAGADSGAEERFISVDVADAAQKFLIEERALDGSFAAAK